MFISSYCYITIYFIFLIIYNSLVMVSIFFKGHKKGFSIQTLNPFLQIVSLSIFKMVLCTIQFLKEFLYPLVPAPPTPNTMTTTHVIQPIFYYKRSSYIPPHLPYQKFRQYPYLIYKLSCRIPSVFVERLLPINPTSTRPHPSVLE